MAFSKLLLSLAFAAASFPMQHAYFLFSMNDVITTERIDPIVSPGKVAGHVHTVVGGSNFRVATNTSFLRQSECTSSPIKEDNSAYWAPTTYFQWANGSFSSVNGNPVIYYLFSDTPGTTTAFPDDFRMISGNPMLRAYDPTSYAQQAITFLCLDFNGKSTRFNEFPAQNCPSGIRAQINFPMCWDGVNADSPDHKSHVAFPSGGPDSGTCSDPKFPKTLPRIFMEMYLDTGSWWGLRDQAKNSSQPFVYSMGDPTGYGYHADFMMGWQPNVLQRVVDECHCNEFGDPTCCSNAGIFNFVKGGNCRITKGVNEVTTGVLATLPGNNPVVGYGGKVQLLAAAVVPALIDPVYAYTGDSPSSTGNPVGNPVTLASPPVSTAAQASSSGGAEKSAPVNPAGQAGSSSSGASSNPAQGASSASSSSSNSTSNSGSNSGSSASAGSPANPAGAPHSGSPPASPASPASGSAPSSGSASPSTSTSASPARVSRLSCLAKQNGTHARRARRAHDSRRKYNAGL